MDLLLPTQNAFEIAALECDADSPAGRLRMFRALLEDAIVGWRGVTAAYLGVDGGQADSIPFDAAHVPEFLDSMPAGDYVSLRSYFVDQVVERIESTAEAKKKSGA